MKNQVKHIDTFYPTVSCFLYTSLDPLHWLLQTPVWSLSLSSVLAQSLKEYSGQNSHLAAQCWIDSCCYCLAWNRIQHLTPYHLCHWLDYPSRYSSEANWCCPNCLQEYYPDDIWLIGIQFFSFNRHLILEFVREGGRLHTKLEAKVIISRISMQLHH